MADPIDYIPQTGDEARTYIIYLVASGQIVRRVYTHPDLIEFNVNKVSAEGVGDPVITYNPDTNNWDNIYPGPGGEAYIALDPVGDRPLFQAPLGTLEVMDGHVRFRDSFGEFNPSSVPADNVSEVVLDNLPVGTTVQLLGDMDVVTASIIVSDGNFELSSPIRQKVRLRVTHPRRITKEYVVGFL